MIAKGVDLPVQAGIGLRHKHHEEFLNHAPPIAWVEVHSENFLGSEITFLEKVRKRYPISLHGVGLSLGSAEGIDPHHLQRISNLVQRIEPGAVSEHLSWSIEGGIYYNDLLPLPYTEEALKVVATNIQRVQEKLKRPLMIENPSTYLQFKNSEMSEADFLLALCKKSGCQLLLDINNIVVSAFNHGWETRPYLDSLVHAPIGEYHLAGHHTRPIGNKGIKIDDHGSPIAKEVWDLFLYALDCIGPRPSLIERDSSIPPLQELLEEAAIAQTYLTRKINAA